MRPIPAKEITLSTAQAGAVRNIATPGLTVQGVVARDDCRDA